MGRRGESGETLAEILVSTTLLGIIGVGIIGAIASVLISTDIDRKSTRAETIVRSYASAIQRAPYEPCPRASYSDVRFAPPRNYTAKITSITAWDGRGPIVVQTVSPTVPQESALNLDAGCTPGNEHGLQRLELQVDAVSGGRPDGRGSTHLTIVKRNPALTTTTSGAA